MLRIHGVKDGSPEYSTAEALARAALCEMPQLENDQSTVLEIFPSVQCFGQRVQDIDLLVFFAQYDRSRLLTAKNGRKVHSFCASVEVKGHSTDAVRFDGNRCIVRYNNSDHDVTAQSEAQKYSVMNYIKKNGKTRTSPYVTNLILLQRVPSSTIPGLECNILGFDSSWRDILDKVALLAGDGRSTEVASFSARSYLESTLAIFSRSLSPSKIDRKRLETITRKILDRDQQQYAEKLGKQLLIFRGRGGTGKTVRLIRIAYQAYDELGLRVVLLTYNRALVADIRRLLALAKVKDAIGEGSVSVSTIHKFVREWLLALDIIKDEQSDFIEKYEEHKRAAIELIKGGAITAADIESAKTKNSRTLNWDLLLIDESQDWPVSERTLIYDLYGHRKVIIADGVDQFVRGVERINWREGIGTDQSQIVSLTKSLRLKASLCQAVGNFAEEVELSNWNLQPEPESHGGRVIIVTGDPMSRQFHGRITATAKQDGNEPIDFLLCVPPSWVETSADGKTRHSKVAMKYKEWGFDCWDAVDPQERDSYPTSKNQFRIVQYDSCRGLEGWVVVAFALDEFFEHKRRLAVVSDSERTDIFFDEQEAAMDYAKKWLMIPLTRAIDTLVIHISDPNSYVGRIALDLHRNYPETIQHVTI